MGVSKVDFGNTTLIDLTGDTVNENNLLAGATAHGADGEAITGGVITHNVIDNLNSTSSVDALSAKQGKVLNEKKKTVHDTDLENKEAVVAAAEEGDMIFVVDEEGGDDEGRQIIDTTMANYENDLEEAAEGDLLIIEDSDGGLGTNVINTTLAELDDAVANANEGDFIITDDEEDQETIDDEITGILTNIGEMSDLPDPSATICENVGEINTNLGGLVFSSVNGVPYVKVGADSPRPFSGNSVVALFRGNATRGTVDDDVYKYDENLCDATSTSITIKQDGDYIIYGCVSGDGGGITITKNSSNIFSKNYTYCQASVGDFPINFNFVVGDVIKIKHSGKSNYDARALFAIMKNF